MGRKPCCSKEAVKKGAWSFLEDQILSNFIQRHGVGNWRNLPRQAVFVIGLKRCGKSCRLRWVNYLKPGIKRGQITEDEEDLIIRLHNLLGNRWSLIAGRLPGRTDNEIKNYWNSHLKKRAKGGKNKQLNKYSKPKEMNVEIASKNVLVRAKAVRFNGKVVKIPQVTTENDNSIAKSFPKSDTQSSSSSCSSLEDLVLDNMGKDLELGNLDVTNKLQWKLDFSYLGLEEMNFELDQIHKFNEEYTWP